MGELLANRALRTIGLFGAECLLGVAGVMIDPQLIAENASVIVAVGVLSLVVSWFGGTVLEFIRWKLGKIPVPPALEIQQEIIREYQPVEDENGSAIEDVCSIGLYLCVANILQTGAVVRNVGASIRGMLGTAGALRLGESGHSVDLRHGEDCLFEIGQMLVPLENGHFPSIHRIKPGRKVLSRAQIEHVKGPQDLKWRTLSITTSQGLSTSLGQAEGQQALAFPITITADDTVAQTVWFRLNLLSDNPDDWLLRLDGKPPEGAGLK